MRSNLRHVSIMQQEVEQGHDNLHSSLRRHLEDEIVTLLNEKELKIQSLAQKLDSYQMKTKVSLDSIAQCQRHSYKLCKTLKQFRWDFDQEVVELQKSLRRDYVKQQTQAQDQDKKTKLIQILRKQLEMSSRTEESLDTSSRDVERLDGKLTSPQVSVDRMVSRLFC